MTGWAAKWPWLALGAAALVTLMAYQYFTYWRYPIPGDSQLIVGIERSACFGPCPTYEVTLYENGTVVYFGRDFVSERGWRRANVGAAQVEALAAELTSAGYFALADRYDSIDATDGSFAVTFAKIGELEKDIRHYNDPATEYPRRQPTGRASNLRRGH